MREHTQDQAKFVRDTKLQDQFGRMWHCVVDKRTGQPTGCPNPIGWSDPLHTPNSYLTVPKWEDGSPRTDAVLVDFDGWIADVRSNMADWDMAIGVMGEKKFPLASPEERNEWSANPHLTREAGPKPFPTVETLKKAQAGDKKLLGLDTMVKSKPTDVVTYKEFMAECRLDGVAMKEVGRLWQEHKDNMKEAAEVAEEVGVGESD